MSSPHDDSPTPHDNDAERDADEPIAPYQPTLISGKWVILFVGAISIAGAAFGWLWTYDAQRGPRDFWGIETWKLIGRAPAVRAERLVPEPPNADGSRKPVFYDGLIVVLYDPGESGRYVVDGSKRVENEPGLSYTNQSASLREALVNFRSYDWDSKAATLQRPAWRYALVFISKSDAQLAEAKPVIEGIPVPNPQATLLFDADCRFVRVPSNDKPIVLLPTVAEQLKKFFETQLPPDPANPTATTTPAATAS